MKPTSMALLTVMLGLSLSAARLCIAEEAIASGSFETSDGVELHYLEAGAGPSLVLVPGWTMPAGIWINQLRHFSATHHVYALDPRGQGRSAKPDYGYHPARRARDIGEFLQHVGGAPAIVAGWSLAMQEVLVMTQEMGTENVRAVVLVDHPIDFDASGMQSRFVSLQTEREDWTRNFVELIHASQQTGEYFDTLTQAALETPTNAAAIMIANLILMGPTDLRSLLESLDRPTLFIASSLDWAVEQAELVRANYPDVRVEVIPNTSHALFVDNPGGFNDALERFIASLPKQ